MAKIKILIVDDMVVIRSVLRVGLYSAADLTPEQIFEAANGEEALKLLEHETVDLIFADINMPLMDGIEFLKELKKRKITTPVVILSTVEAEAKINEAISLGAAKYIHKPFHANELKAAMSLIK